MNGFVSGRFVFERLRSTFERHRPGRSTFERRRSTHFVSKKSWPTRLPHTCSPTQLASPTHFVSKCENSGPHVCPTHALPHSELPPHISCLSVKKGFLHFTNFSTPNLPTPNLQPPHLPINELTCIRGSHQINMVYKIKDFKEGK